MKKIILTLALLTGFVMASPAIDFKSQSFISSSIQSLSVSNTLGVTNLISATYHTNTAGTVWTNGAGENTVHSTNVITAYKNLLQDANMYPFPVVYDSVSVSEPGTNSTMANIYIRIVAQSGANTACTFIFVPLPDGEHESTVAGDALAIAVTSAGATEVTSTTRVPAYKWSGSGKLRLKSITHPDADATSRVTVLNCSLNGFTP